MTPRGHGFAASGALSGFDFHGPRHSQGQDIWTMLRSNGATTWHNAQSMWEREEDWLLKVECGDCFAILEQNQDLSCMRVSLQTYLPSHINTKNETEETFFFKRNAFCLFPLFVGGSEGVAHPADGWRSAGDAQAAARGRKRADISGGRGGNGCGCKFCRFLRFVFTILEGSRGSSLFLFPGDCSRAPCRTSAHVPKMQEIVDV